MERIYNINGQNFDAYMIGNSEFGTDLVLNISPNKDLKGVAVDPEFLDFSYESEVSSLIKTWKENFKTVVPSSIDVDGQHRLTTKGKFFKVCEFEVYDLMDLCSMPVMFIGTKEECEKFLENAECE